MDPQSNKYATGGENKATAGAKLNDSPDTVQYQLKGLQHLYAHKMCVVCMLYSWTVRGRSCNYMCVKLTELVVTRI